MQNTFRFDKKQSPQKVSRKFSECLQDFTINLEIMIHNIEPYKESTYGKNLLRASISLLEAFANSLLMSIKEFSKEILKKIERLPFIDKCDFLCSTHMRKPLDRTIFIPVHEFFVARNSETHPKPKKDPVISIIEEDNSFSFNIDEQKFQMDQEKAIELGKEIFMFLDKFLFDICEVSPNDLILFLSDYCSIDQDTCYSIQKEGLNSIKLKLQKLLGIQPKCLSYIGAVTKSNSLVETKFISEITKISIQ